MTRPVVDMLTGSAAVVLSERPVVPCSPWISELIEDCGRNGLTLQLVTPSSSRITMPLRLMLTTPDARWVAHELSTGDYYDGLSGARLHWDGASFAPPDENDTSLAPGFGLTDEPESSQLTLTFRLDNPATADMRLGGGVEQLARSLSGQGLRGWDLAEPMGRRWQRDELTEYCRQRMPEATWLFAIGGGTRPVIANMRVSRSMTGVEEWGTLVIGYAAHDEPAPDQLADCVAAIASGHHLVSLFAQLRPGRQDLTSAAQWEGNPMPIGMFVGPSAVSDVGLERAMNPPGGGARQIESPYGPTVWYALGDGRSAEGWKYFERVMRHMRIRSEPEPVPGQP